MSDSVSRIYSDAQKVGRMWVYILAIIFSIIGLIVVIGGIVYIIYPSDRVRVFAKITATSPTPCRLNHLDNYVCKIDVEYIFNGTTYNSTISYVGDKNYQVGDEMNMIISRNSPHIVYEFNQFNDTIMTRTSGVYAIIGGFFIIGAGWLSYWLTKKYDFIAAGQGVGAVGNLVHNF